MIVLYYIIIVYYIALDRNDNNPQFEETRYSFSVVENTDVLDSSEFIVRATDADLGSNQNVLYSITDGNIDNAFVIGKHIIT